MDKLLIYTTVGKSEGYVKLLDYFCESLCLTNNDNLKNLLILCDKSFHLKVRAILEKYAFLDWHIMDMPDSLSSEEASMHKLNIFEWPHIMEYNNCLFVDADCLFTNKLNFLFDTPVYDNKLYIFAEMNDTKYNNLVYFCLSQENNKDNLYYSKKQLEWLDKKSKFPFNAGLFLFKISPLMKLHFKSLVNFIKNFKGSFFYEQSFMNTYFHLNDVSDFSKFNEKNVFMENAILKPVDEQYNIIHFNRGAGDHIKKEQKMKKYLSEKLISRQYKFELFENRIQMINELIPYGATIAEIGVFKGQFTLEILKRNPKHLYLIDCWENHTVISGDQDGNNVEHFPSGEQLYKDLKEQLKFYPNVSFHRQFSNDFLPLLKENTLDAVYIDGDHSYEAVKRDLEMSYPKIKQFGWIMGHDYEMNYAKTNNSYQFGVKQAVDEFCAKYDLKICAKGMDGCVSYAIWKVPGLKIKQK